MSGRGNESSGSMRWLLTYADMITLLLAFFVILYAISKLDVRKYQALATSLRGAFGGPAPTTTLPPGTMGPARPEPLLPRQDPVFEIGAAAAGAGQGAGAGDPDRAHAQGHPLVPDTLPSTSARPSAPDARRLLDKVAGPSPRCPRGGGGGIRYAPSAPAFPELGRRRPGPRRRCAIWSSPGFAGLIGRPGWQTLFPNHPTTRSRGTGG
jgi:hypothetical protein